MKYLKNLMKFKESLLQKIEPKKGGKYIKKTQKRKLKSKKITRKYR